MAVNGAAVLRSLELRLLRCTLQPEDPCEQPSTSQSSPTVSLGFAQLHSLLNDLVVLIESGDYGRALASPASQVLFSNAELGSSDSASFFYSETLPNCVSTFLGSDGDLDALELGYKAVLVMAVGVAALLAFTQRNITGPVDNLPLMPLGELITDETGSCDWMEWEEWAHKDLISVGSDLSAKFSNLQYLVFGKSLLMRTKDVLHERIFSLGEVRSITWWLTRALFLQQKLLDGLSSSIFDLLNVFMRESLLYLGTEEVIRDYWPGIEDCKTILSILHLEMGIVDLYYGRLDTSKQSTTANIERQGATNIEGEGATNIEGEGAAKEEKAATKTTDKSHFESASVISNFNFSVSGALGFRTQHQVEPKAQLRLVACTKSGDTHQPASHEPSNTANHLLQKSSETYDTSDILITPRFVAEEGDSINIEQDGPEGANAAPELTAIHQAVALAHCLLLEKDSRSDELQKWKMAPYIEAIDSQSSSPFIIQCFCNILRVRWESSRSRTKERALLMMENLVERVQSQLPRAAQRLSYCFAVSMPPMPLLQKEHGNLLVSCGLIGEAIRIYEDLELWDDLILCYQLMDRKSAAVELIRKRLSERPSDSRLWCSLGDVTYDDAYYEKALEVSGHRSSRAFRSLARSAYSRGEYEKSKVLWESAMALNSLHPNGWFALGSAALKCRDVDKALDAFTRAVQLDPENGEAWNNIACLHMLKKKSKESFIAFKEALKLKRDSWEMWENFSHVAVDVGNFSQALEAVQRVFEMSKKKRIDHALLERVMLEVECRSSIRSQSLVPNGCSNHSEPNSINSSSANGHGPTDPEANSAKSRETEHLVELLGKTLKQMVQSGGTAEIWGLYARWHKLKGDLPMCSEALLKQVRSYQGSDLWTDKERFAKFTRSSLELSKVYQQLAFHNNSRRELFAAEMHLKSSIKQALNFIDTQEYRELVACLEDVQQGIKSIS